MDKKIKGILIRGAFCMSSVKEIHFRNNTIPPADDFNGLWDDLSPGTQDNWEKLATILESVIKSEMWKQANQPSVTSEREVFTESKSERLIDPQLVAIALGAEPIIQSDYAKCICITHEGKRYHHPQCTSFHTVRAVGYVGGKPKKPQLFCGMWPHGTLVDTYDDRCEQCKEFDNDGCPSCGPNTIKKVFDPAEDIRECPFENGLCPQCNLKLEPNPSGWSCANSHGY